MVQEQEAGYDDYDCEPELMGKNLFAEAGLWWLGLVWRVWPRIWVHGVDLEREGGGACLFSVFLEVLRTFPGGYWWY